MRLTSREKASEWVRRLKVGEVITFENGGNFYALRVVDKARDGGVFSGRVCDYNAQKGCYRVKKGAGRIYWTIGDLVGAEV